MKTTFMKAICLCLALVLCIGCTVSVSAAEVSNAPIDEAQEGSLTIFKYDLTGSENDGVWDSSYVSTGVADESGVNETMKNYALEGVEFRYGKVADIVQFTAESTSENHVETLYYDTLEDDCHLYTYGIDLTKQFSDGNGDFSKVAFVLFNETDNYYVKATLNESEGVYYVTAHVADEADATHFVPVASGKVAVKGLEDDSYRITEVRTDNGYTLLKKDIAVDISQTETDSLCDDVAGSAEHHLLTAAAQVDGNPVTMLADGGSDNAEAPLTVVNTRGFDLPETGDNGTMMFTIVGILLMAGAVVALFMLTHKKSP